MMDITKTIVKLIEFKKVIDISFQRSLTIWFNQMMDITFQRLKKKEFI